MDAFESAKLRIKETIDLVDEVSAYVSLRRRGQTMVGLCPFHDEKSPSFTVYPGTQHFKCYGCGKAGDVFTFVMEREGLGFREAMTQLAEKAAVPLDGVFRGGRDRDGGAGSARLRAQEALGAVRDWFVDVLHGPEGAEAREYLERRGLSTGASRFGLGVHPAREGSLLRFVRDERLPRDVLVQAGLIGRSGREVHRGRLMFPITDERGKVVGFGGRVLPSAETPGPDGRKPPKYLNSPESPIFLKRKLLYGLAQTKAANTRRIVVVEGYTDVIACHLAGEEGAVATLGTALTSDHATTLKRWAHDGVTLLFDGDKAGRRAAERAFKELVHTSLPVRIALLPEGEDPADLAGLDPALEPAEAEERRRLLQERIGGALDALTMWFRLLRDRLDMASYAGAEAAGQECVEVAASVEDSMRRNLLVDKMAAHLGLPTGELAPRVEARRRKRGAAFRSRGAAELGGGGGPGGGRDPRPSRRSGPSGASAVPADDEDRWGDLDLLDQRIDPETDLGGEIPAAGGPPPRHEGGEGPAGPDPDGGMPGPTGAGAAAGGGSPDRYPPIRRVLADPLSQTRLDLVACVFREPDLVEQLEESAFAPEIWTVVRDVLVRAFRAGRRDASGLSDAVFAAADSPGDPINQLCAEALDRSHRMPEPRATFERGARGMSRHFVTEKLKWLRRLHAQATTAGDHARRQDLSRQMTEAMRALRDPGTSAQEAGGSAPT